MSDMHAASFKLIRNVRALVVNTSLIFSICRCVIIVNRAEIKNNNEAIPFGSPMFMQMQHAINQDERGKAPFNGPAAAFVAAAFEFAQKLTQAKDIQDVV